MESRHMKMWISRLKEWDTLDERWMNYLSTVKINLFQSTVEPSTSCPKLHPFQEFLVEAIYFVNYIFTGDFENLNTFTLSTHKCKYLSFCRMNILLLLGLATSSSAFLDVFLHNFRSNCTFDEFECDNRRCIAAELRCNDRDDCHDQSDENDCGKFFSFH